MIQQKEVKEGVIRQANRQSIGSGVRWQSAEAASSNESPLEVHISQSVSSDAIFPLDYDCVAGRCCCSEVRVQLKCKLKCMPRTLGLLIDATNALTAHCYYIHF